MKLNKLNSITSCVISICFTLVFIPACNNSKEPEDKVSGKENENKMTTGDTSTAKPIKKTGKVTMAIPPVDKTSKMETDKMGYYNYTETAPFFPGGQASLETYMSNNIEYPREAIDNGAEGTVNVMFTIDENGKPGNAKTTGAAIGYGFEEEAVRVINGMSNWTPGMIKGNKVKAWYTLPITFRLE